MAQEHRTEATTPLCRFLFPHLFEPRQFKKDGVAKGDPRRELVMLFDRDMVAQEGSAHKQLYDTMRQAIMEAAKRRWPSRDIRADVQAGTFRWPLIPGEKRNEVQVKAGKQSKDYYEGQMVMQAASKASISLEIVDVKFNPIVDQSAIYSGCWGHVNVTFNPYTGDTGKPDGVSVWLNKVIKVKDGDRIAGRTAREVFSGIVGGETESDAEDGLDDEIPF